MRQPNGSFRKLPELDIRTGQAGADFPRGVAGTDPREMRSPAACWEMPDHIARHPFWEHEPGRFFLGQIQTGGQNHLIGVRDNRHLMTVAGSRSGKGTSVIIPNLIDYPGSILVIDPKGENARITARTRTQQLKQRVAVLDPFGTTGLRTSVFNPLEMIDVSHENAIDDAAMLAEGLIKQSGGNDQHWTIAARNLIRGLILFVATDPQTENRNLKTMRRLLMLGAADFKELLDDMKACEETAEGVIAGTANSLSSMPENERGSVISTAREQTHFLDSPPMQRTLVGPKGIRLEDLKGEDGPMTVYLCLPAGRMATHAGWLRMVINLAVIAMERTRSPQWMRPPNTKTRLPVLFLMDEFPILGHMETIEAAAGQIAGFDVLLWPIIQDLSQLQRHYRDGWETFLGNAGVTQWFGNSDATTLEYLSKRLGKTAIKTLREGELSSDARRKGLDGSSYNLQVTELMQPDEISRYFSRTSQRQIILFPGAGPIVLQRANYYDHPYFGGRFSPIS